MKTHIMHREVLVKLVDKLISKESDEELFGQTETPVGHITVSIVDSPAVPDNDFVDTVIHELVHAIESTCGVDLEHAQTYTIAAGLTQALIELGLIHPPTWRATLRTKAKLEQE